MGGVELLDRFITDYKTSAALQEVVVVSVCKFLEHVCDGWIGYSQPFRAQKTDCANLTWKKS